MTGIADVANFVRRPLSRDARDRLLAAFKWWKRRSKHQRFVVLAWRRTGSNLLCGMLHNHPEITMHNELFNNIDVFTYHPREVRGAELEFWSTLARDTNCEQFLDHIWSACDVRGDAIRPHAKAVGFKSFPEHWKDGANEDVFERCLLRDPSVKMPSFYARSPAKPARAVCVAVAATTIISAQELTRVAAALRRLSLFSFSRRFDWFDGTADDQVLDMQLRSLIMFIAYVGVVCVFARFYG